MNEKVFLLLEILLHDQDVLQPAVSMDFDPEITVRRVEFEAVTQLFPDLPLSDQVCESADFLFQEGQVSLGLVSESSEEVVDLHHDFVLISLKLLHYSQPK